MGASRKCLLSGERDANTGQVRMKAWIKGDVCVPFTLLTGGVDAGLLRWAAGACSGRWVSGQEPSDTRVGCTSVNAAYDCISCFGNHMTLLTHTELAVNMNG